MNRTSIDQAIDRLAYDFAHFEVETFLEAVERVRRRELIAHPVARLREAMWSATEERDFIFYPADLNPFFARHALFHEVGHMLLGHRGIPRREGIPVSFLQPVEKRRTHWTDPEDVEAELFALRVAERIRRAEPAQTLPAMRPFIAGLKYEG